MSFLSFLYLVVIIFLCYYLKSHKIRKWIATESITGIACFQNYFPLKHNIPTRLAKAICHNHKIQKYGNVYFYHYMTKYWMMIKILNDECYNCNNIYLLILILIKFSLLGSFTNIHYLHLSADNIQCLTWKKKQY